MSDAKPALAREDILPALLNLAQTCQADMQHTQHVTGLALKLFDFLVPLHHLGQSERDWLEYAGWLHDIGLVEGGIQHHKTGLRIILGTPLLPFDSKQRLVIGSIVRYHRKAEPSEKHDHYAALSPDERQKVLVLSGILRLADSLDRSHQSLVKKITCRIRKKVIIVTCLVTAKPKLEFLAVEEKGRLIEKALARKLELKYKLVKSK